MTESFTGVVETKSVGADPGASTALLTSPSAPRHGVLVTNNTPGTIVFVDDVASVSRQFPIPPGKTRNLPFAAGQIYAYFTATTCEGEALEAASVEVRPILVESSLGAMIFQRLGVLLTQILSRVMPNPSAYDFDIELRAGCDYNAANGSAIVVPFAQFDVAGRSLQARKASGEVCPWLTLSVAYPGVAGRQTLVMEAGDAPRGNHTVDVVAVFGADELATLRGRIRVT
ncbi:MAG: hypothetical protein ACO1SV_21455 [Fimbriimonas sp.]